MYVEIEKHEIVQEELMKGMEQKNPKVVAACVTTLHTALKQFGNKVITIKPMVKKIPVLLADRDKGVRDEMKSLVVEMHRPVGQQTALVPSAVVQQELRESFTTGGAQPTRYLRSQQHRVRDAPSADAPDGAAEDEDVDAAGGDSVEMDPFDMLDPVEILSKLPKDFYEKLEATKWQERKEALDALDNLLKTAPRLEPGDYADLVRALKKVISKDANVMLVALGGRLLAAVASGLRNKFQPYATACVQAILEKFKEKKTNVVTALREAIDAIYPSDMLAAFDNKNPSIKAESAVFLAHPSVRDAAAEALGTATKLVGEKNIAPHIGKLEPLKEQKIKEFAEKAEIKVKVAAPKKETKLKVAPNADVISGKYINYGAAGRPDSWRDCNSELWGPSVVGSITLDETTEDIYSGGGHPQTGWISSTGAIQKASASNSRLSRLSNSGSELEDSSSSDQEEMNQPYSVDMRDVICELRDVAVLEEEGEVEAISCVSTIATIVGEMETIENVEGRVDGATGEDNAAGDFDASFSWSDDFSTFSGQEEQYTRDPGPRIPTENILDIFNAIWDLTIISLIVEQTNLYAWQTIAKMSELGALPKYLDLWGRLSEYWSTGTLGMPDFRKLMSKNRFQLLMRFLHFSDNDDVLTGLSGYQKKITKIAPILNHMNKKFAEICIPQRELSLDESLLLWKGRLSWEQIIRSKAARYGLKLFDLCEAATGYLIRTIIYAGKDSSFVEGALHGFDNKSAKVVLELMDGFLDVGHLVVMDNWYNQLALTRYLKKRQTDVLGTINKNRQQIPLAIKNLDEKRMQRGQQVACHCGDIAVIAWKDVKLVTVISTYHSNEQVVGRRSGQELIKPVAIDTYNKTMGGVDLKDMKLSNFPLNEKGAASGT
ncbi:hypothetical protein MSG28_009200 [Choristoneura fumiferana]|uniref:Uncharacterized protein n=1 Tax=Choristoneura fumiferana TaxID=7141 RepID=A0ACC0KX82_CHOFU|nr:hypothetical protein MSG28_009200 [Choristoneura fumiferana]